MHLQTAPAAAPAAMPMPAAFMQFIAVFVILHILQSAAASESAANTVFSIFIFNLLTRLRAVIFAAAK